MTPWSHTPSLRGPGLGRRAACLYPGSCRHDPMIWLLGKGLHVILRNKAVEVCSCTVVSGAKVRDIHFIPEALSYGDPALLQWSWRLPKDRSTDTCRIPQGLSQSSTRL